MKIKSALLNLALAAVCVASVLNAYSADAAAAAAINTMPVPGDFPKAGLQLWLSAGQVEQADGKTWLNGNTVICNWCAGNNQTQEWAGAVQVFEVTPEKKVVWALSSWKDPDLGTSTSIQLLDDPGALEDQGR